MRPNIHRSYTVTGRFGIYTVPTLATVDHRLRILAGLLQDAATEIAPRIRHDLDLLLDWRLELMAERGATT